jgi:spore germination protein GerM
MPTTPSGQTLQVSPPKNLPGQAMIYVINPKATGNDDPLMPRTVTLSQPESPARSAINALLSDPNTPVPAGTSLRGLTIESALATLDFSRSPVNETGGEGGQGDALTALGRTLGQFPEIDKFQISVKGKLMKSFGEFTTDGPMDVTRPGKISDESHPETKP